MVRRYIIFNSDDRWIQGDVVARSPEDACRVVERHLSAPTANEVWLVFEAPPGFPPSFERYAGDDARLLGLLEQAYHAEVRNGFVPEQPELPMFR